MSSHMLPAEPSISLPLSLYPSISLSLYPSLYLSIPLSLSPFISLIPFFHSIPLPVPLSVEKLSQILQVDPFIVELNPGATLVKRQC